MKKASDRDWVNNERNGACTSNMCSDIIIYMGILAHEPYSSVSVAMLSCAYHSVF